jgi:WD40 repeat protein
MPGDDESTFEWAGEVLAEDRERAIDDIGRRAGEALRRPAPAEGPATIVRRARNQRIIRSGGGVVGLVTVLIIGIVMINRGDDSQRQPVTSVTDQSLPEPTVTASTTRPASTTSSVVQPAPGSLVLASGGKIDQSVDPVVPSPVAFSADGSVLAVGRNTFCSGCDHFALRLYDPHTLALKRELTCPTSSAGPLSIPDASWDQQAYAMWDAESRALLTALTNEPRPTVDCRLVFSADGGLAARGGTYDNNESLARRQTRVWNTLDGTLIGTIEGGSPLFSLDGTRIVTDDLRTARVWDARTLEQLTEFDIGTPDPSSAFTSFVFTSSQDKTRVLLGGQQGGVVLDARTFDRVADISFPEPSNGPFAINSDGTLVASASRNTVFVWDVASGAEVDRLEMDDDGVAGIVVFSPDGAHIAATNLTRVYVWDLVTGDEVYRVNGQPNLSMGVTSLTFSLDGALLATAAAEDFPRLFDTTTGQELGDLDPNTKVSDLHFIVFSPDGTSLALGGTKGVQLWNYTRA